MVRYRRDERKWIITSVWNWNEQSKNSIGITLTDLLLTKWRRFIENNLFINSAKKHVNFILNNSSSRRRYHFLLKISMNKRSKLHHPIINLRSGATALSDIKVMLCRACLFLPVLCNFRHSIPLRLHHVHLYNFCYTLLLVF